MPVEAGAARRSAPTPGPGEGHAQYRKQPVIKEIMF